MVTPKSTILRYGRNLVELVELLKTLPFQVATGVAFVVGFLLARLFSGSRGKPSDTEDPRNHRIRELEADLRTVNRELVECTAALDVKTADFDTAVQTLQGVRLELVACQEQLAEMKLELKDEMSKTRGLRTELQDRASETIRHKVRASEAETELDVSRAGSEAVLSEISRLQEERKTMTDTMRHLEDHLLPDDGMLSESND
jgi:hypothetical protein